MQVEKKMEREKKVKKIAFQDMFFVEMVMTDEAWFVVRNTPNVTDSSDLTEIDQTNSIIGTRNQDILVSMGQTVQEFDIDVGSWSNCWYY